MQIALPDLADKQLLAALKPNVAFVVPPSLQSLLTGTPRTSSTARSLDREPGADVESAGFNILDHHTICAFLVLNIFLSLFNLFFGWLFAMKICSALPQDPAAGGTRRPSALIGWPLLPLPGDDGGLAWPDLRAACATGCA